MCYKLSCGLLFIGLEIAAQNYYFPLIIGLDSKGGVRWLPQVVILCTLSSDLLLPVINDKRNLQV